MSVKLSFDSNVYALEAVMATAYWCANKLVADITTTTTSIDVTLNGLDGHQVEDREVDEFKTRLIHNQIRHRLAVDFAPIEKAIVEKAFAPVSTLK